LAIHNYETLFILDSNKYVRDVNGVSSSLPTMVEKLGGEVLLSRLWNEQKLAYPIDGHKKGTYWIMYFKLESTKLSEFERACQLNEAVLRQLTVRIDPRLIDILVANAKGGKAKPAAKPEPVAAGVVEGAEVADEEVGGEEAAE
jgi:small subunit ribosomal protein S6